MYTSYSLFYFILYLTFRYFTPLRLSNDREDGRRDGVDATLLSYTLRYINLPNFNGHNMSGWVTDAFVKESSCVSVCMRERGAGTGGGGHTFFEPSGCNSLSMIV